THVHAYTSADDTPGLPRYTLFHEGWLDVSASPRAVFVVQTSSSCMGAPSKTSPVVGLYSGREA
ncbi:hypothetical protein ALC56_12350, partial [Trachymyrmex septentrionalis]